ncbi:MAG TPA: M48 family metalloprotease, partial [Alkalispirochaeta sp.]|nr:M48 family metalloprotease [Alkalispirochaeta sp.]
MDRFGVSNIRLYVNDDENVNAYAIQNPTRRVVVLTRGLLESFSHLWTTEESDSETSENDLANYSHAVAGIIGHELSHLKHTDNLPAW